MSRAGTNDETAAVCDRFEREGLLGLEQGLPLDAHFDTCPDCRAARLAHERLLAGLGGMDPARAGRADWQARVWAGLERRQARRRRRWMWLAAPAVLAAAAAVVLLLPGPPGPAGPTLAYAVHRPGQGAAPLRSDHVQPGDTLAVRAVTGGAHAELRLYRDDRALILRCSDEPPCTRRGDLLRASVPVDERGRYQIVLLHADQPLPAPTGALDRDIAAARAAGATVELRALDVL